MLNKQWLITLKAFKFVSYPLRALATPAQQSRTIRLPIHIGEKLNKIKKAQRELASQLGRGATTSEVAHELGMESAKVREYLKAARVPMSLDVRIGDEQDTELSDMVKDNSASPFDYTTTESMRQDVRELLSKLNPKEREVLSLRFGARRWQRIICLMVVGTLVRLY